MVGFAVKFTDDLGRWPEAVLTAAGDAFPVTRPRGACWRRAMATASASSYPVCTLHQPQPALRPQLPDMGWGGSKTPECPGESDRDRRQFIALETINSQPHFRPPPRLGLSRTAQGRPPTIVLIANGCSMLPRPRVPSW